MPKGSKTHKNNIKMNWGADRKVMPRIYRSHIRIKLDYISSIYRAICKSYLKNCKPCITKASD